MGVASIHLAFKGLGLDEVFGEVSVKKRRRAYSRVLGHFNISEARDNRTASKGVGVGGLEAPPGVLEAK